MIKLKNHTTPIFLVTFLIANYANAARISDIDRFQHNDGRLNLYLRGMYINTEIKNDAIEKIFGEIPGGHVQGASAVAAILDYNSPYLSNYIGIDSSLYAVGKLTSEDSNRQILDDDNSSYAKIGQLFVKAKYHTKNTNTYFQIGRGRFEGGTIGTRDTRGAPDTYEGARISFDTKNLLLNKPSDELKVSYTYISKASLLNEESFNELESLTGNKINSSQSFSIEYDAKIASLRYGHGYSEDYINRNEAEITFRIPLSDDYKNGIMINAQIHKAEAESGIWDTSLDPSNPFKTTDAFDKSSKLININTGIQIEGLRIGLSFTKVDAKLTNGKLGYAFLDNAENVIGSRSMWTISGSDFNNDGEETFQLAAEYNVPGFKISDYHLSGLSLRAVIKKGSFDADNPLTGGQKESVNENQQEYRIYYRFDKKDYSGLSVGLSYAKYDIDKDFVALVSAQPEAVVSSEEMRVYMDYAF